MNQKKYITCLIVIIILAILSSGIEVLAGSSASTSLSLYTWSRQVQNHPNRVMQWFDELICLLVDCKENKWFLGENLFEGLRRLNFTYTPNLGEVIPGVDLGVSVQTWDGNTLMYMGDSGKSKDVDGKIHSWGNPSLANCGVINDCSTSSNFAGECTQCNDPIALVVDTDGPENGIDSRLLLDPNDSTKFWPLLIPGVNAIGSSLPSEIFKPFNQPTGAAPGISVNTQTDYSVERNIYLWFVSGLKSGMRNNPNPVPQSYLTCSEDGVTFGPCPNPVYYPKPPDTVKIFSRDKFIFVDPVFIHSDIWNSIDASGSCTLCKLKPYLWYYFHLGFSHGMLLFGASGGEKNQSATDFWGYRESPLYLGYMELQSLRVWYYTGDGWSLDESDAKPIMVIDPSQSEEEQKKYWFGEFSLKLIESADIDDMRLVLLSNHPGRKIYYRTASLLNPDQWSDPQLTCAIGYGPYIIDEYTEIKDGHLIMYHTIDGWNGNQHPRYHEPYGVFTGQLRLRQDPTDTNSHCGDPPVWPPP